MTEYEYLKNEVERLKNIQAVLEGMNKVLNGERDALKAQVEGLRNHATLAENAELIEQNCDLRSQVAVLTEALEKIASFDCETASYRGVKSPCGWCESCLADAALAKADEMLAELERTAKPEPPMITVCQACHAQAREGETLTHAQGCPHPESKPARLSDAEGLAREVPR